MKSSQSYSVFFFFFFLLCPILLFNFFLLNLWSSLLSYVVFFVAVCYHTIYAKSWIFPPLAFYGLDILMRMFRQRIKDAILVPVDDQMTLVSTQSTFSPSLFFLQTRH